MSEPKVGQIYEWRNPGGSPQLYVVLGVHRKASTTYDLMGLRNTRDMGRVFDHKPLGHPTLYEGTLTDEEHRLTMSALLDVDAYIREHSK